MTTTTPSNLEHAEVLDQIKILKEITGAVRRAGLRCHRQDSRDALAMLATELDQTIIELKARAADLSIVHAAMPIATPKPSRPPVLPPRTPTLPASVFPKPSTPKEPTND